MSHTFLVKEENGKVQFVAEDTWAIETSSTPKSVKAEDVSNIMKQLIGARMTKMIGLDYEYRDINSVLRRLANLSRDKSSAVFSLAEKTVNFSTGAVAVQNAWIFNLREVFKDKIYPVECKIRIWQTVENGHVVHKVLREETWQNA